jgi:integrase
MQPIERGEDARVEGGCAIGEVRLVQGYAPVPPRRREGGREASGERAQRVGEPSGAASGVDFQFRDLRAKAATDLENLDLPQKLLGHSGREMTEHYKTGEHPPTAERVPVS